MLRYSNNNIDRTHVVLPILSDSNPCPSTPPLGELRYRGVIRNTRNAWGSNGDWGGVSSSIGRGWSVMGGGGRGGVGGVKRGLVNGPSSILIFLEGENEGTF